ncbi:MAG TPA: histidine kinase dimerization/phospho-acceptor domain-containing protein, partial [Candidatus Eisenbacteria bacterium]|nr:histidine kinase dimerization/phospho-acceptor domain-containing protein [Candidatus Eisenbacteria bacterium]
MPLKRQPFFFALLFLFSAADAFASQMDTQALTFMISGAVIIGILTAFALYKAAHARRQLNIEVLDVKNLEVNTSGVSSSVREKVKKIPMLKTESDQAVEAISQIVQEETEHLLQEIKEEYSVKYQLIAQEKNREVEVVKKEFHEVKDKFETTQKLYQQSESEKKTTEAVVRSIAEGLVVVNQKGEVLLMNPSAEKLLGAKKEKMMGKPITDDMRDDLLVSISRDSGDNEKMIEYKSKDENVRRILRQSSAVIQNENGQTVGMVNILTDVTKQKELDEIKNKFVSNVTHELRTPIVAMQKAIAILLGANAGPLNETQSNFLNIVSRNLSHLSRLVEDLLEIAKIESGKLRLKIVPARLDKVVGEVCDTLDTWAKSKEIQIIREIDRG